MSHPVPSVGSASTRRPTPVSSVIAFASLNTPVGRLHLFGTDRGLLSIALPNEPYEQAATRLQRVLGPTTFRGNIAALEIALTQLTEYFTGKRQSFAVPLDRMAPRSNAGSGGLLLPFPMGRRAPIGQLRRLSTIRQPSARWARPMEPIPCHSSYPAIG